MPVPSADLLPDLQDYVGQIHVSDLVLDYILDLRRSLLPVAHLSARATGRWWRWPGPGHARLPALRATRRREHLAVLCLAHRLRAEGKLVDGRAAEVRAVVDGLAVPDLARS